MKKLEERKLPHNSPSAAHTHTNVEMHETSTEKAIWLSKRNIIILKDWTVKKRRLTKCLEKKSEE